ENNLYRALVGEARALVQARDTGWWWLALDNLKRAGRLNVPARDPAQLTGLAIECMGSEYPCLRQHGTWAGHRGPAAAVAASPDGRLAATGGEAQAVRVWAVPSGRALATLTGHKGTVRSLAFHPEGRRLASAAADRTVRLWDLDALART